MPTDANGARFDGMGRQRRAFVPGRPAHVWQRGNDRQRIFRGEGDFHFMWRCLRQAAPHFGVDVNGYVFMNNHVHLMLTPREENSIQRMMQWTERRYSAYFNAMYRRTGTLFEGRYKASVIEDLGYLMTCHRYLDLNPVRAGMVNHPADYGWSSFRHYACGVPDPIIVAHHAVLELGYNDMSRREAYASMVAQPLDAQALKAIRESTQSNCPMGNAVRRGRPRRNRA